jgi:hypothetical protein
MVFDIYIHIIAVLFAAPKGEQVGFPGDIELLETIYHILYWVSKQTIFKCTNNTTKILFYNYKPFLNIAHIFLNTAKKHLNPYYDPTQPSHGSQRRHSHACEPAQS